jgi:MFS family permease
MLTGSKLQDVLGRKKTFFVGVIIYGIGTITAALSVNVFMLFIGWSLLEGIGAALMFPATTTMVSAAYEGKDRLTAFGIWGGASPLWELLSAPSTEEHSRPSPAGDSSLRANCSASLP